VLNDGLAHEPGHSGERHRSIHLLMESSFWHLVPRVLQCG
jgi:hypothetical protein